MKKVRTLLARDNNLILSFFRSSQPVPFGAQIRPVRYLMEHLLGHALPAS